MSVTELGALLGISQPAASRHLKVLFLLDDGWGTPHVVLLETGIGGSVSVGGVEVDGIVREVLRITRDVEHEVWITNADGSLRVEVDGRPAAAAAGLRRAGKHARLSVATSGQVDLISLEVGRDLVHDDPQERTLGAGEYFVVGDNGTRSKDSRAFGPIRGETILGRVFAVAWPPRRARWIR